jgi:parallel beta-helix repeat protein
LNINKALILIALSVIALCAINTQMVFSQNTTALYILEDGTLYPESANGTILEQNGNVYTLLNDLPDVSFVIQRSNIVLDGAGYTISGDGEIGVDISDLTGVTVKDLKIVGPYMNGIYIAGSLGTTLTGNTISGNGWGLFIYNSSQNIITGNEIVANNIGIDLETSRNNILKDNNLDNTQNLAVFGDTLAEFALDMDTSNKIDDKTVYYLVNKNNLVINPTTYTDVGLLALVDCENITVQNLELTNNGQALIVAFTSGSKILGNTIMDNHQGILLFGSSGNEVTNNIITQNYRGLQISRSSKNNRISNNNIKNNEQGILLFDSSLNTFIGNTVQENKMGIGFNSASNNMIYGNYFVDNTDYQVYDAGIDSTDITNSTNYWNFDYPIGGNYWSDYKGVDFKSGADKNEDGSDDIGDSPYVINSKNKDEYPLLPYGSGFGIAIDSPEGKTYYNMSVTLTYQVTNPDATVTYSLDGEANVTISGTTTLSDLSEGSHTLKVYAKDTDGTVSSDTVYFATAEEQQPAGNTETKGDDTQILLIVVGLAVIAAVILAIIYFLKGKK